MIEGKSKVLDYKTMSAFRAVFHERNKLWCPDPSKRLTINVETHFLERLFERFSSKEAGALILEVFAWMKKNYEKLIIDNKQNTRIEYRPVLKTGTAVFVLFNGQVYVRTCFTGNEE